MWHSARHPRLGFFVAVIVLAGLRVLADSSLLSLLH